jgi:hypothetical protein
VTVREDQAEQRHEPPDPNSIAKPGEYWVVTVEDVDDFEKKIRGYKARFTFTDPAEAWQCWASASRHGFLSNAEHTRDLKAVVS